MTISQRLILFEYLLEQFGFDKFEDIQARYKDDELGADIAGHSGFLNQLSGKIKFNPSYFQQYDENIIRHLAYINNRRGTKISLKYYQYFSLLFTEFYLHHYFTDADLLAARLNDFGHIFSKNHRQVFSSVYIPEDMNLLAFWQATGSGKTFTLHFNILQYRHYCRQFNRQLNNIILLTPGESLSRQHLAELELSGIEAGYYLQNKSSDLVKVIDIHKIKESVSGQGVTVSVSEFGQQNAVFVDEGHKGNDKEESVWRMLRERMGYNGFTFEYSATFGQVSDKLQTYYAKAIVFDYSYKYFHRDGYGKDYWIHNITDENALDKTEVKHRYLMLNMLLFAQQKFYYKANRDLLQPYQVENPLLIFVGHTVNPKASSQSEKDENKETISDIKILLTFLDEFLKKRSLYEQQIAEVLQGEGPFGAEYNYRLTWLLKQIKRPAELYDIITKEVFNAGAPDKLELYVLSKNPGEIALKVKGNNAYFGLINIGDVSTFKTSLEKENEFVFEKDSFTESLFETLSAQSSNPVNLLIGARKFIEGWNNYRVSGIGLINFGKSEGAQIIQLFGRGVRLKGKANSLKRTTENNRPEQNMPIVETLNIFGLNARYMSRFRDDLEKEDIRTLIRRVSVPMELFSNEENQSIDNLKLITLKKKDNIPPFFLATVIELVNDRRITIQLDMTTKKLSFASVSTSPIFNTKPFLLEKADILLPFIDFDALFLLLADYKKLKGYNNLYIFPDKLPVLFRDMAFKVLTDEEVTIASFSDIEKMQKIVSSLFKQYIDIFYNRHQRVYESNYLKTVKLTRQHEIFQNPEYIIEVKESDENGKPLPDIDLWIQQIEALIGGARKNVTQYKNSKVLLNAWYDKHLYQPLLLDAEKQEPRFNIQAIFPKGLNEGEQLFVEHLQSFIQIQYGKSRYNDCEFYLLRNSNRSKGFGFYFSASGGFYPDFLLWIKQKSGQKVNQYLSFIDPHGLRNEKEGFNSDKIMLHKNIKELEAREEIEQVVLNSFILSPSSIEDADINRWNRPENITDIKTYCESLHIFEIGKRGENELKYIEKMIEIILEK